MARSLPPRPSPEYLSKEAKALLRAARQGDAEALALFRDPDPQRLKLAQAQFALARDYGFESWPKLKAHVESLEEHAPHDHVRLFERFHDLVGSVESAQPIQERLEEEVKVLLQGLEEGEVAATTPLRFYVPGLKDKEPEEILAKSVDEEDVRHAIAQMVLFDSWKKVEGSDAMLDPRFEEAADAIVLGDIPTLERCLKENSNLIYARSAYGHRSTLLHYVSANGVEIRRQRTPSNIVAITKRLLEEGADPDAVSGSYGGGNNNTPLCLTVSSGHPADVGLQGAIAEVLLDGGAAIEGLDDDGMPLSTALAFGYRETAEFLVRRGARVENIVTASALGRIDLVSELLGGDLKRFVDPFGKVLEQRQDLLNRAYYLAAQQEQVDLVRLLLDSGAEVNAVFEHGRIAMHWVAYGGNENLVTLLVDRGADLARRETFYGSTPADWAREGGHDKLAARLEK